MKPIKKIILPVLALGIILLLALYHFFRITPWASFMAYPYTENETVAEQSFSLSEQEPLRQTGYNCGAYDLHFLLQAYGKEMSVEEVISQNQKYEIPRLGVVPEVLVQTLKNLDIESQLYTFRYLSDSEKTNALKSILQEKPMVLLIHRHGFLHFVLVTGYENDTVHIYDSMVAKTEDQKSDIILTKDNNGDFPGNDSLSFSQLMIMWDSASTFGFYKDMGIVIEQ